MTEQQGAVEEGATPGENTPGETGEIDWDWNSTLYSRTDERGVIQQLNPEFLRVSQWEEQDLIGSPHRVIRHPDMPRGLFYLVWQKLMEGKPVVAFVKNQAKQGGYYWAMALAMPCDDGFLSVRFRPQGELFATVQTLYAELLEYEKRDGKNPERSCRYLLERLGELGYETFEAFMSTVLFEELRLRDARLESDLLAYRGIFDGMLEEVDRASELARRMSLGFQKIRGEPINMRILAGRLDGSGAAISSISQNYESMATEMWDELGQIGSFENNTLFKMRKSFHEARMSLLITDMIQEASQQLGGVGADVEGDGPQGDFELLQLKKLTERSRREAAVKIGKIVDCCNDLPGTFRRLRRRINGLDVVKLFCRVESGRVKSMDAGLDGIIDRLDRFHSDIDGQLSELTNSSQTLSHLGHSLLKNSPATRRAPM
ncbi:MAG: hypothetical protein CSA70_10375 [Rhodobacterales bacterium]|nr:MAG: hypothetical protein CSA70_10375 [Rhodobacterales bacterium]